MAWQPARVNLLNTPDMLRQYNSVQSWELDSSWSALPVADKKWGTQAVHNHRWSFTATGDAVAWSVTLGSQVFLGVRVRQGVTYSRCTKM